MDYPSINASHSTLTIDAAQTMPLLKGLVMKPFLRRIFYGINFTPFIQEAERRITENRDLAVGLPRVAPTLPREA